MEPRKESPSSSYNQQSLKPFPPCRVDSPLDQALAKQGRFSFKIFPVATGTTVAQTARAAGVPRLFIVSRAACAPAFRIELNCSGVKPRPRQIEVALSS
jgi:hypothetical protein